MTAPPPASCDARTPDHPRTAGAPPEAASARATSTTRRPPFVDLPELQQSLAEVATRTRDDVGAVDGLGVTVQLGGQMVFGGANAFTDAVDDLQYAVMEGPCLQAQASGGVVRSHAIGRGEERWPRFTAKAADLDLRSVVSSPLTAGGRVVGSLNLYGATADRLLELEPSEVRLLADTVARALPGVVLEGVASANSRWFAGAVRSREDVDLAVEVLVQRYDISDAEAHALIQQLSLEDEVSESVAARTVIRQDGAA